MAINVNHDMQMFTAQTTDATATTIFTYPIASRSTGILNVRMLARDALNDDCKTWDLEFSFRRNADGTMVANGAIVNLLTLGTLGAATWTVSGSIVSGQVDLIITGAAGRTIDWSAKFSIDFIETV